MFGEEFGLEYAAQRHQERLQEAEQARFIRCLEAAQQAERRHPGNGRRRLSAGRRMVSAAGEGLIWIGCRLQQVAN